MTGISFCRSSPIITGPGRAQMTLAGAFPSLPPETAEVYLQGLPPPLPGAVGDLQLTSSKTVESQQLLPRCRFFLLKLTLSMRRFFFYNG